MVGEKGWWEDEDEAEASLIFPPDSFKPDDEVEVEAGGPVVWMLAVLLFLFTMALWSYLENRISTSDSIFVQVCCGPLLGFLWYVI